MIITFKEILVLDGEISYKDFSVHFIEITWGHTGDNIGRRKFLIGLGFTTKLEEK